LLFVSLRKQIFVFGLAQRRIACHIRISFMIKGSPEFCPRQIEPRFLPSPLVFQGFMHLLGLFSN